MQDVLLAVRQKAVDDPEKSHQHQYNNEGTEIQDHGSKLCYDRPVTLNEHLDVVAEDHQHKR